MKPGDDRSERSLDEFAPATRPERKVIRPNRMVGSPGGEVFAVRACAPSRVLQVMQARLRLEPDGSPRRREAMSELRLKAIRHADEIFIETA